MTPLSSCLALALALAMAMALAAVPDVVPVSRLALAPAMAMAVAVSKGCMQQLVPVCISLFKCISACPSTHQLAPRNTQAGRQAGTGTGPAMSLTVILGFAEVGPGLWLWMLP